MSKSAKLLRWSSGGGLTSVSLVLSNATIHTQSTVAYVFFMSDVYLLFKCWMSGTVVLLSSFNLQH